MSSSLSTRSLVIVIAALTIVGSKTSDYSLKSAILVIIAGMIVLYGYKNWPANSSFKKSYTSLLSSSYFSKIFNNS